MDLKDFFDLEFYKELPLFWQIIFAFFVIMLGWFTILLKNPNFRTFIANGFKKMFHFLSEKDLLIHPLFYNKRYYLNQLHNINFQSSVKTKLFRLLLTEVITASIELPYKVIQKTRLKHLSPIELRNLLHSMVYDIKKRYEQETRTRFIELYGREKGINLFILIYESSDGFKIYHHARLEFIIENIERVMMSQSKSLLDSVRTILTQIDIATDLAIIDCETAFKELNGRIENIIP